MIASRLLIEFDLLKKGSSDEDTKNKRDIGLLVVCSLGALATHLLSYVNQNLWCWRSLFGMTIYLGKVGSSQLCVCSMYHVRFCLSACFLFFVNLSDYRKTCLC